MDSATTVRSLLELAGVSPPEDEVLELIAGYPAARAALDAVHAVADLPATDGILVFRPAE